MMPPVLLLVASCILAALGFGLIAISQAQNWAILRVAVAGKPPMLLRPAGFALLGLSAIPAVMRDGVALGLVLWTTILTIAAFLIVAWLAKRRGGRAVRGRKT